VKESVLVTPFGVETRDCQGELIPHDFQNLLAKAECSDAFQRTRFRLISAKD